MALALEAWVWQAKFTDTGEYQIYDRLRKPLEGSLLKKNAEKFIENDGSKRYRIVTHPDFVTYERGDLVKHTDAEVRALDERVPSDGGD